MSTKYEDLSNEALDRMIVERVLGWKFKDIKGRADASYWWNDLQGFIGRKPPRSSKSFDSCLEHVIPAMRERGFSWTADSDEFGLPCFSFMPHKDRLKISTSRTHHPYIHPILSTACCVSALLALDSMEVKK